MFFTCIFRNKKLFLILVLTLLFDFFLFSRIQEPKDDAFLSSEYRIPLFAIDSNGKAYFNLNKENMELSINGKPIEITELRKFSFLKTSGGQETAAVENEQEGISKKPERVIFIVFDAMFSSNYGIKRAREIASEIVKNASGEDSFVLLVNSARDGLNHIFGPEKKMDLLLKEIKKAKIFPGVTWFKDTFSSRKSYMDRFSASDDYKVNEDQDPTRMKEDSPVDFKRQYIESVKEFHLKADQVGFAFQMVNKPKVVYLFSEGFQGNEIIEKYFSPYKAESPDSFYPSDKPKLDTLDFSGVISEYFRKLFKIFKEGGNIIYSINPGQLKTMSYDSSGAMELQFFTGDKGSYFQGLNTVELVENLLNASAAYFELVCHRDEISGNEHKIEVNCSNKDISIHTPSLLIEKTYQQMSMDQKKMFAIDIVTGGISSRMIGKTEKVNYRKNITKTKDELFQCAIDVQPPKEIQNRFADIFSIALNKKEKKWYVQMINRVISEEEKLNFIFKNRLDYYELYFAFVDASTASSIYNKIE